MILGDNESRRLMEKISKFSQAESFAINLRGGDAYNLRFAVNSVTTDGFSDSLSVSISSNFGKRTGTVALNKFDDDSIKEAVKKSEEIAKLSPENKEFMPPLEAQTYSKAINFSEGTTKVSAGKRASYVSYVIEEAIKKDVTSAGFFENDEYFTSILNSNNLFVYNRGTRAGFSATARSKDGSGSGRFEKSYVDIKNLENKKLTDWVIERSVLSKNPAELKPGHYTVILEPAAAADMIGLCLEFMGSRPADEGRSFFSKQGGGNKIGEELADKRVTIYSDPVDINAPSLTFNSEGMPRNKTAWFESGIVKNLHRNRFWAEKTSQPAIPFPSNLIMTGSNKSIEQLISETDYAILVTRFWYIRTVEQRTMLLTGLTRDGVFEVKDGKINRPVKNFRFNESPVNILKNLDDMSKSEKATGSEIDNLEIYVPALRVKDFNFSSLSDAI